MQAPKAAVGFIFVTVLIDVMGFGIIIPIIPDLIKELSDLNTSEAAFYGGLLTTTYAIMQLIFAPILGGLSDKYGRRPLLLIALLGLGLDYLVIIFAPTLAWFFLARIVSGICGSSFTVANAYIADISKDEDRAKNFGLMGAAFGLGFILGPILGGYLGEIGIRVPFIATAVMTLLNWLYGYFVVPESLAPENRRNFSWERANPIGTLKTIASNKVIVPLLISFFLIYVAGHATQSNWAFFGQEKFAWTPSEIGLSLSFVGVMVAIVQGFAVPRVVKKWGETRAVFIGFLFNTTGLVLFGVLNEAWMMYAVIVPYAFSGLAGPSLQSIMAGQTPGDAQGELQGGITQVITLTNIVGPLLMTGVFRYYTADDAPFYFPGAPFILASVIALLSILVAFRSLKTLASPGVKAS